MIIVHCFCFSPPPAAKVAGFLFIYDGHAIALVAVSYIGHIVRLHKVICSFLSLGHFVFASSAPVYGFLIRFVVQAIGSSSTLLRLRSRYPVGVISFPAGAFQLSGIAIVSATLGSFFGVLLIILLYSVFCVSVNNNL